MQKIDISISKLQPSYNEILRDDLERSKRLEQFGLNYNDIAEKIGNQ